MSHTECADGCTGCSRTGPGRCDPGKCKLGSGKNELTGKTLCNRKYVYLFQLVLSRNHVSAVEENETSLIFFLTDLTVPAVGAKAV